MNQLVLKDAVRAALPTPARTLVRRALAGRQMERWVADGCPIPAPNAVKQNVVRMHQKASGHRVLIETGTYLGNMIEAQRPYFDRIVSIELSEMLWERATRLFAPHPEVKIVRGDSAVMLAEVLKDLHEPAVFWLDGHYSAGVTAKGAKECPVLEELEAIFAHPVRNHVILIDDARAFDGTNDYPTLDHLTQFVAKHRPDYRLENRYDVIRLLP
ncbi:MAG: hypothetical protein WBA12_15275 [Catalinimonas sp.]